MFASSSSGFFLERVSAAAVIVAAGGGTRLGGTVPKQYRELRGEPILGRALRPFLDHPEISHVVVVLPPADATDPPAWLAELPLIVVPGGKERGDSVWQGLLAVPEKNDPILIHDGARPFVPPEVIGRVLRSAQNTVTVPAIRVTDTIKEVDDEGRVRGTPDRNRLWRAQTPQGFPRRMILDAHRRARELGLVATDDASLCEGFGWPVRIVEGAEENIKITTPFDFRIAEVLAARGG